MTNRKITLVAPNGLSIIGIRLEDGSIHNFEYFFDNEKLIRSFILKDGVKSNTLKQSGDHILVDSNGNNWPATDVEYDSILKG